MKRLPVNLASNPIEHRQWLRRVKLTALGVVGVLSVLHLALAWSLLDAPQADALDIEAMAELRAWSDEVAEMVSTADPRAAQRAAVSVGLANALIEQRVFPWAGLFSLLEESIPDDVRLEIIQPITTIDGVRVTLTAASASDDSLLKFLGALEARPELRAVYPGRQLLGPDGDLRLSIEAFARGGSDLARPEQGPGRR
jgi:Tfp pilus assembly protein PilN